MGSLMPMKQNPPAAGTRPDTAVLLLEDQTMQRKRVSWLTLMLFSPALALAGPPIPYGGWTANNGIITAGCGPSVVCGSAMSTQGILQREVTAIAENSRYIQSIITDSNATGSPATLPFHSESFVKTGGEPSQWTHSGGNSDATTDYLSSGISVRQVVKEAADGFDTTTRINTGWAAAAGEPNIEMSQSMLSTDAGIQTNGSFYMAINADADGNRTGFRMGIDQTVSGGSGSSGSVRPSAFALREVAGDMLTAAGSASFGGSGWGGGGGGWGGGGSATGGNVTWKAGDDVKVTWVGQSGFGFQAYDNLSDSSNRITTFSLSSSGPFSWVDPPFGPKPSMPSFGGGGGGWGW